MCGIVGYIGDQQAVPILMDCLSRLEYRGYDSAGVAALCGENLETRRASGRNAELASLLGEAPLTGTVGIAHTRWATHGKPTALNAHPHQDCHGNLAVVHNGIIENHQALRDQLLQTGHTFGSETDSEVVAHLFEEAIEAVGGCLEAGALKAVPQLEGAYAIAVVSKRAPDKIIAARNRGAPLIIGYATDGCIVSSDISAVLHYTTDIRILDVGEIAIVSKHGAKIMTFAGEPVEREAARVAWRPDAADRGGYDTFMLKEIHEQPIAIANTIKAQTIRQSGEIRFPEAAILSDLDLKAIDRIGMVACGTSYHAALVGKFMLESIAKLPVDVDIASEYRYRPAAARASSLTFAISQSGETADTLGAIEAANSRGSTVVSICNVPESSMARASDGVIYTQAGPEIGVASTKAFTTQLTAIMMFAISAGLARGTIDAERAVALQRELGELPDRIQMVVDQDDRIAHVAKRFDGQSSSLYLGRGVHYPIAEEGALKLKEISYVHAEAYPAGEMKHGPIALISDRLPVVIMAPTDRLHEKTLATIEEVRARDGLVIAVGEAEDAALARLSDEVIAVPSASELISPIIEVVALQLLAYHVAIDRGCDVDKPRNLAKSVTVE